MSDIQTINLKIGDYEVHPIPTGMFGLDGGAMFGTVPKVLWEKAIPPDAKNRIPMEARALLLKGPQKNILIDCGNGGDFITKYGEKLGAQFAEMYNVDESGPSLKKSLAKYGLEPKDINEVIFSHMHFDHCGGGTEARNGKLVPTFANAKYYVQKANYQTASAPNRRERASYFPVNFQPILDAGQLHLVDGPNENLLPGISVGVSNGHTLGQQWVRISDANTSLVYCADLIPTHAHIRLAWIMGYDLDPLGIIEEKQKLLTEAAAKAWYLFFEHDPFIDACQVQNKGNDFVISTKFRLN